MRIDYSPPEFRRRSRAGGRRLLLIGLCGLVVAGMVLISKPGDAKRQPVAAELAANTPKALAQLAKLPETGTPAATSSVEEIRGAAMDRALTTQERADWHTVTVASGDTLSRIFDKQKLPPSQWLELLALGGEAKRLTNLRVGDVLRLRHENQRLQELAFAINEAKTLQISRDLDDELQLDIHEAAIERRVAHAMGVIDSSLFMAGAAAGMSDRLIMEMANVFGYDVDFALDIRRGDRFTVVYEELYKNGDKLRDGNILAAEFVNRGRTVRAVTHTLANGDAAFFTPDGASLKKAFIRTPLDVFRISSHFNPNRKHPVLNRIRAHKGTDYAAPTGTPIKATGEGKIVFRGNKGGYGRAVIVRHGSTYQTLYAHMSSFRKGLSVGSRVKQGQIIGYVGQSGLASGPHLHYEFLVNGVHRNPVSVSLPRAEPIPRSELPRFRTEAEPLLAQLDVLSNTQVAALEQNGL